MAKQAIILASHGHFAREALKSAEMIIGTKQENVAVISVTEDKSYDMALEEIKKTVQSLDTKDGCLILTDIYGGTPSNIAVYMAIEDMEHIRVFSGLNMPLLLEILLDSSCSLAEMEEKIEQLQQQTLINVSKKLRERMESNGDQEYSY